MTCAAAALQNDAIWLELKGYDVVPLNTKLTSQVYELSHSLRRGVAACPDSNRTSFYNVELTDGLAYVHVHDETATVYLVAYVRN